MGKYRTEAFDKWWEANGLVASLRGISKPKTASDTIYNSLRLLALEAWTAGHIQSTNESGARTIRLLDSSAFDEAHEYEQNSR